MVESTIPVLRRTVCLVLLSILPFNAFAQTVPVRSESDAAETTSAQDGSPVEERLKNPPLQTAGGYQYPKPKPLTFLKQVPSDLKDYGKATFTRENTLRITAMVAGTALLVAYDQQIYEGARKVGDGLHISHKGQQKTIFAFKTPFRKKKLNIGGPYDLGTAMYFLGDGWLHMGIAGGFLAYGAIASNNKALQTSSQIVESILVSGIVVQTLKHVTGRETPNTETAEGGKWRLFPNQIKYHQKVNKYDAYPTGHLAAAMATVTVIAENYPDNRFVRPVGYTLMTVLGFQMVNNGVHWASDYPLGIALGYSFAKIAVNKGRLAQTAGSKSATISPAIIGGGAGLQLQIPFTL